MRLLTSNRFSFSSISFYSFLVCSLLLTIKLIVPSFYIHNIWRRLDSHFLVWKVYLLRNIDLLMLRLNQWLLFPLDQKWSICSSSLSWLKIIPKQLIHIVLINIHIPLLILEVLLRSSLFFNLENEFFTLIRHKRPHNCPKELTLRKLLFFSMRSR